jgi:hypothetical protein
MLSLRLVRPILVARPGLLKTALAQARGSQGTVKSVARKVLEEARFFSPALKPLTNLLLLLICLAKEMLLGYYNCALEEKRLRRKGIDDSSPYPAQRNR